MATAYETARTAYLQGYLQLLDASAAPGTSPTFRGGGPISPDLLGQRASALAVKSGELTQVTAEQLKTGNNAVTAIAASSLLEQASADMVVARTLLENIKVGASQPSGVTQRAVGDVQLRLTAMNLNDSLPPTLEGRAGSTLRGAKIRPQVAGDALADLRNEIQTTLNLIEDRALAFTSKTGRDLLRVASTQWNLVVSGVQVVSQSAGAGDLSKNLEQGLTGALTGLVTALAQVIGGVIAKVNALLQGNPQAQAAVLEYLNKTRTATGADAAKRFDTLIDRMLGIKSFLNVEVSIWMEDAADQDVKRLNDAADQVAHLADNYSLLTKQAQKLMDFTAAGSILASTPALMAIAFGLQVSLLATVIFAAYDHVDMGGKGINVTKGVKQILVTQLGVTEATRQRGALAAEAAKQKAANPPEGTPPPSDPPATG